MPIPAGGLLYAGRDEPTFGMEVEAAFGADLTADPASWSWTDLSSRLRAVPIILRAGKSGGASRPSPGTCSVTLDNDDSALTPLHPLSPYWPNVELGTPVRVRLRRAEDAFARTVAGGWGTADSGQAWTGSGADFFTSAGVARHVHSTVNFLRRSTLATTLTNSEQMVDVAPSALLTGAALVTGLLFRYQDAFNYYWLRTEFNSGGTSVMLKITRCVAGVFSDLATVNPLPDVPYAAGSYLRVRASVVGSQLAMKVWNPAGAEPAGWTLTATDSSLTAAGATGLQSWLVGGNTNTLPVEARYRSYSARVDRFSGFADQWEPTYLPTGVVGEMSSAVRITASGLLRRLQQGDQPDESALRRTIAASNPVAYYPAEDGNVATAAGSAVSGQNPLVVSGGVEFKPVDDFTFQTRTVRYGTSALADLADGGTLAVNFGSDAAAATQSAWTVHVVGAFDVAFSSGDIVLMEWTTPGGAYTRWQLVLAKSTLHTQVIAYTGGGTPTVVVDRVGVLGGFRTWVVSAEQVGGSINVSYRMSGSAPLIGVLAGTTLGGVASMRVNPTGTTSSIPMPFGHLAVWATYQLPYDDVGGVDSYGDAFVSPAATSYRREAAHVRLARLAAEDGIAFSMPAVDADAVMRMGWQPPGVFADLAAECVDVDGGLLYESGFGLAYVPRSARYNRPVDLTIDLATYAVSTSGEVLDPTFDDQTIRNRWTVSRRDGSFAVADDVDSQRRGVYPGSIELNLADDDRLGDQAGWRVRLGTVVDLREDTCPIDLAANPDLIDGWLSCGVGSRVVRVNPPAQHRPGPLDRLVAGWTETIGPRSWMVQVMPEPAAPWDVAVADGAQRAGADGSALQLAVTATETVYALTNESDVWTTDPEDFPIDLRVGGERVRADAPGRVINVNPWLITDAAGWEGSGATISHVTDVVRPDAPWGSLRLVVTGAGGAYNDPVTVTPTTQYRVTTWVRGAVTGGPAVDWQDGGGGYISTSIPTPVAVPAGLWLPVTGVVTSPAGAAFARMRARHDTATPAGTVWHATGITLAQESTVVGAGAFRRMSSAVDGRGLNGVQRAWPAGTEVDVWTPAIAPL